MARVRPHAVGRLVAVHDLEHRVDVVGEVARAHVRSACDLRERDRLRRRAGHRDHALLHLEVFRRGFEEVPGDREHLLLQEDRGVVHRGADHRAAPAPTGARPVGRRFGVALMHGDVVGVHAEELGGELRGGGLEPLAVRARGDVHVDVTVGCDAQVRGLVAVGPEAGLRLHVHREADAEQSPCGLRLRLLGAEVVVADDGDALLERLLRRHVVDELPAGGRVGKIGAVDDVATAQLDRVHADRARHDVDHLLAADGLHHPRPAVRGLAAGVRPHRRRLPAELRDAVRPGEERARQPAGAPATDRVRTRVVDVVDVRTEEVAVVVDGHRDRHLLDARVRGTTVNVEIGPIPLGIDLRLLLLIRQLLPLRARVGVLLLVVDEARFVELLRLRIPRQSRPLRLPAPAASRVLTAGGIARPRLMRGQRRIQLHVPRFPLAKVLSRLHASRPPRPASGLLAEVRLDPIHRRHRLQLLVVVSRITSASTMKPRCASTAASGV